MSVRRALVGLLVLAPLVGCLLAVARPALAQTAPSPAPGPTVTWGLPSQPSPSPGTASTSSSLLTLVSTYDFSAMYSNGIGVASAIFLALVALDFVILTILLMLNQRALAASLAEMTMAAVVAVVIFGGIQVFNQISSLLQTTACSLGLAMVNQSQLATGSSACTALTPQSILMFALVKGANIWLATVNLASGIPLPSWWPSGYKPDVPVPIAMLPGFGVVILAVVWAVFVGSFIYIAGELCFVFLELNVVGSIGCVMLGFLGSKHTRSYGVPLVHYLVNVALRLLIVYVFVGLGMGMLNQLLTTGVLTLNQGGSWADLLEVAMGPAALAFLVHRMDRIGNAIFQGKSSFNVRDEFTKPLIDALRTFAEVAVAVALGKAALAGGQGGGGGGSTSVAEPPRDVPDPRRQLPPGNGDNAEGRPVNPPPPPPTTQLGSDGRRDSDAVLALPPPPPAPPQPPALPKPVGPAPPRPPAPSSAVVGANGAGEDHAALSSEGAGESADSGLDASSTTGTVRTGDGAAGSGVVGGVATGRGSGAGSGLGKERATKDGASPEGRTGTAGERVSPADRAKEHAQGGASTSGAALESGEASERIDHTTARGEKQIPTVLDAPNRATERGTGDESVPGTSADSAAGAAEGRGASAASTYATGAPPHGTPGGEADFVAGPDGTVTGLGGDASASENGRQGLPPPRPVRPDQDGPRVTVTSVGDSSTGSAKQQPGARGGEPGGAPPGSPGSGGPGARDASTTNVTPPPGSPAHDTNAPQPPRTPTDEALLRMAEYFEVQKDAQLREAAMARAQNRSQYVKMAQTLMGRVFDHVDRTTGTGSAKVQANHRIG